jgi:hypothetical protein
MAASRPGASGNLLRRGRPAAVVQVTCAALLAVLVLAGGLEIHPAAESHDPVAGMSHPEGETYFPAASHPVLPHHAEGARMAQRPVCPICLSRLQNVGAPLALAALLSSCLAGGALPIASALSPLQRSLRPDGARAPPAA